MSSNKKSTKTKTEILDATWSLIAERGAEVTVAEIARASSVSRQAVYLHFGSRGGLLMALVKRADERFKIFEEFEEALNVPDPENRLRNCLGVWLRFVRKILPVARDLIRLREADEEAAVAWNDRMADARKLFRQLTSSLSRDRALSTRFKSVEAADYIWAISSVQLWDLLTGDTNWKPKRTESVIIDAIVAVVLK